MAIRRLDHTISIKLQSQISIDSLARAIYHLLVQSISHGSSNITVAIDFDTLSIRIHDDGTGISQNQLKSLAKSNSPQGISALMALASVSIISKVANSACYCVQNGTVVELSEQNEEYKFSHLPDQVESFSDPIFDRGIADSGTIIIVEKLFESIPVRRNIMLNTLPHNHIEQLKIMVTYALAHLPKINLKILQLDTRSKSYTDVINIASPSSFISLLNQIFGKGFVEEYEIVKATSNKFKVSGIISKRFSNSKDYQFLLLDGEPITISSHEQKQLKKLFTSTEFESNRIENYPVYLISFESIDGSINEINDKIYQEIFSILCKTFISFLTSQDYDLEFTSLPEQLSKQLSPTKSSPKKRKIDPNDLSRPTTPTFPSNMSETAIRSISAENNIQFSKDDFKKENYTITKQVDNKFILMVMKINNESTLIMADQHACDERIRVEALFQEFLNEVFDSRKDLGKPLIEPLEISMTQLELDLMTQYQSNLNQFGIHFFIKDKRLFISKLPNILIELVDKNSSELKLQLIQHLYDLQNNKKLKNLTQNNWWKSVTQLPEIIIYSIKSKACKTAIKFGDELTKDQMENMIHNLSKCNLPFQCAHARPTMIPLVNLGQVGAL